MSIRKVWIDGNNDEYDTKKEALKAERKAKKTEKRRIRDLEGRYIYFDAENGTKLDLNTNDGYLSLDYKNLAKLGKEIKRRLKARNFS